MILILYYKIKQYFYIILFRAMLSPHSEKINRSHIRVSHFGIKRRILSFVDEQHNTHLRTHYKIVRYNTTRNSFNKNTLLQSNVYFSFSITVNFRRANRCEPIVSYPIDLTHVYHMIFFCIKLIISFSFSSIVILVELVFVLWSILSVRFPIFSILFHISWTFYFFRF